MEALLQPLERGFHLVLQPPPTPNVSSHLIADSAPLVDLYYLEAEWGFTRKGPFKGFKLHTVVNQLGLPLKATVTLGNRHDSPLLLSLLEDLEAEYVLTDAGYDSKGNIEGVKAMGAEPVIAANPRRSGKKRARYY